MTFCDVWVATNEGSQPPDAWLPDAEIQRLARVTEPTTRQASRIAQALLRLVLSDRLGSTPARVPLLRHCPRCDSRQHGPLLVPASGLSVSVAHSGPLVVAAVSDVDAVGVDIERLPPPTTTEAVPASLLDLALSPSEKSRLHALPEGERGRAFRQLWTRKEAVLKACGEGVLGAVDDVRLSPLERSRFFVRWPTGSFGRPHWVTDLDLGGHDAVGSVCVTGDTTSITVSDGDVALREGLHQWEGSGHARDARAWR